MWTSACCAAHRRLPESTGVKTEPLWIPLIPPLPCVPPLRCSLCLDDFNYSEIKCSYAAYALSQTPVWSSLWMLINVEECVWLPGCLSGKSWWPSFISPKLQLSTSDIRFCDEQMAGRWSSPPNLSIIWIINWTCISLCLAAVNPTRCCPARPPPVCLPLQYWESLTPFLTADLSSSVTHQ